MGVQNKAERYSRKLIGRIREGDVKGVGECLMHMSGRGMSPQAVRLLYDQADPEIFGTVMHFAKVSGPLAESVRKGKSKGEYIYSPLLRRYEIDPVYNPRYGRDSIPVLRKRDTARYEEFMRIVLTNTELLEIDTSLLLALATAYGAHPTLKVLKEHSIDHLDEHMRTVMISRARSGPRTPEERYVRRVMDELLREWGETNNVPDKDVTDALSKMHEMAGGPLRYVRISPRKCASAEKTAAFIIHTDKAFTYKKTNFTKTILMRSIIGRGLTEIFAAYVKDGWIRSWKMAEELKNFALERSEFEIAAMIMKYVNEKGLKPSQIMSVNPNTARYLKCVWRTAMLDDGSIEIVLYKGPPTDGAFPAIICIPDHIGTKTVTCVKPGWLLNGWQYTDRIGMASEAVREISVPGTIKTIPEQFLNGHMAERVTLSEGVERIETHAFFLCLGLREVRLPSSLKEVEAGAFEGCFELEKVIVPEGAVRVSADAFGGCPNVQIVTEKGDR